jgi:aldose 1-epimerase
MHTTPQVISLRHTSSLQLTLMDYGATWLSCKVPMPSGDRRETLLGCATTQDYAKQHAYIGAMIGRFANRIGGATFVANGQDVHLHKDAGHTHQLHGGPDGYDQRFWTLVKHCDTAATFTLLSPDCDQGFPGALDVCARITLSGAQQITLRITATLHAAANINCPVSITHHPYFNLDAVQSDVRNHHLQINAEKFLPIDPTLLPVGALRDATGAFDFRHSRTIGSRWLEDSQQKLSGGYDHAFLLKPHIAHTPAASLTAADGKLKLLISTTLPALQLYTGQFLGGIIGRDGTAMNACAGVALEPQFLPDSPNHPEWPQPSCCLSADSSYDHTICYDFITPD